MKISKKTVFHRGFTLVELLVVIVIVVTLASLAFIGGQRALSSAKNATSTNNLRQLYNTMQIRMQEQVPNRYHRVGQFIPAAGQVTTTYGANQWGAFNWVQLLGEVEGYCEIGGRDAKWTVSGPDTFFHSPFAENDLDLSTQATIKATAGYAYNYNLGGWVAPHSPPERLNNFVRIPSRVKNPSNLICFIETNGNEEFVSANSNFSDIIANWTTSNLPYIEGRKGYNVVHIDGSAGFIRVSENSTEFDHNLSLKFDYDR